MFQPHSGAAASSHTHSWSTGAENGTHVLEDPKPNPAIKEIGRRIGKRQNGSARPVANISCARPVVNVSCHRVQNISALQRVGVSSPARGEGTCLGCSQGFAFPAQHLGPAISSSHTQLCLSLQTESCFLQLELVLNAGGDTEPSSDSILSPCSQPLQLPRAPSAPSWLLVLSSGLQGMFLSH